MNKTAEIVIAWTDFEENHSEASLVDFCRYYLLNQTKENEPKFLDGLIPPDSASVLVKMLVKIVRMYSVYLDIAVKELPIKQAEEFYFLSIIKNLKEPKKTEVIFHTVNELSNGLNIIK